MECDIKSIKTKESIIFNSISHCLEEGESIVFDRTFDFQLPQGSKKLKWPPKTYVEVKYRLIYDSLFQISNSFNKIEGNKLIVIVVTEQSNIPKLNDKITNRNIDVESYDEFVSSLPILNAEKADSLNAIYIKAKDENVFFKAKEAIKNNKISLFLGAGVSASAGIPTWGNLLEQLCVKKGLSKLDSDIDSIIKGRFIIDEYEQQKEKMQNELNDDMNSILYANIHSSSLIKAIADVVVKSNVESIISYNYDDLVEQEIRKKENAKCRSIYDKSRQAKGTDIPVYHVHGLISQNGVNSPIVLGEKEYHKIYQEAYNWSNVEQLHSLCRNVCFFIGLSMNDPNLRRIMDISIDDSEFELVHFAFLRKIEYDIPFMEKIMSGFGVNCIWYDNYEDLPKLLRKLIQE